MFSWGVSRHLLSYLSLGHPEQINAVIKTFSQSEHFISHRVEEHDLNKHFAFCFLFGLTGGTEVGKEEKQAKNELWEAQPRPTLLLWQEHHPQDFRETLRVSLRVRPAEPAGVHGGGAACDAGGAAWHGGLSLTTWCCRGEEHVLGLCLGTICSQFFWLFGWVRLLGNKDLNWFCNQGELEGSGLISSVASGVAMSGTWAAWKSADPSSVTKTWKCSQVKHFDYLYCHVKSFGYLHCHLVMGWL